MKCSWNEMVSKPCVAPYAFQWHDRWGRFWRTNGGKSHRMTRWWLFCKRKHVFAFAVNVFSAVFVLSMKKLACHGIAVRTIDKWECATHMGVAKDHKKKFSGKTCRLDLIWSDQRKKREPRVVLDIIESLRSVLAVQLKCNCTSECTCVNMPTICTLIHGKHKAILGSLDHDTQNRREEILKDETVPVANMDGTGSNS